MYIKSVNEDQFHKYSDTVVRTNLEKNNKLVDVFLIITRN